MSMLTHSRARRAIAAVTSGLLLAAGLTVVAETVAPDAAFAAQDPTSCQGAVALTNGSFEVPAIADASYKLINESQVPGWLTTDTSNQVELWSSGFNGVPAGAGRQFAELNANSPSRLYQDVATTPGQTLAWSLKHRGRSGTDTMRVMIGAPTGALVQNGPSLSDGTSGWGTHSGTYTVPAGQTVTRFGFEAASSSGGNASVGNFLDDISFGTSACLITTKTVTNLTSPGATAEVGDVLRYTVTTRNNGGNPALQSVSSDQLDTRLDFVPGSIRIVAGAGASAITDAAGDDRGEFVAGIRTVRVRLGDGGTASVGGSIGVGSSTSYTFDAKVKTAAATETIVNEAQVAFRDPVSNQIRTSTSQETQTPVGAAADLAITKTLDTARLVAGEPAAFTITVTNNGPQTATGVAVTDAVPAGLSAATATSATAACTVAVTITCDVPDLAVGASATINVSGTVLASVAPGTALTNTAFVSGSLTDPNPANNTASASGTVSTEADVAITKTFLPADPTAGGEVVYTLTATNNGPSEARDVAFTDPLDPDTTLLDASSSQGTCTPAPSSILGCDVGVMAPGDVVSVTVRVQIDAGIDAVVQNSASVTSSTSDPDPSNNVDSTSFQPEIIADMAVEKTSSKAQVTAGEEVAFTLLVSNVRTDEATSDAVNAVLEDTLPAGFTVAGVDAPAGAACTTTSKSIRCLWPTFLNDTSATVVVRAIAAADAPMGTVTNTASVTAPAKDPTPTNNADSVDVQVVQSADVSVVKTTAGDPVPGSDVTYTMTIRNDGPSVARGVTMNDSLPAGFTYGSDDGGCIAEGSNVTCDIGDLASGAQVQVQIIGTWGVAVTGTASNTATVTSPTPDPNLENNTSTVDKILSPSADVAVTKTPVLPTVPLGGEASFTVTVTNTGPSAAAGVIVEEFAPEGLTVTGATPSIGSWSAADATWTVGTLLPGVTETLTVIGTVTLEGVIVNAVTARSQTPDPDTANNTDTATITGTPSADLAVMKTASTSPASLNSPLTYTITVTNNGPSAAASVFVTDPLPPGLLNAVTSTPGCVVAVNFLSCTTLALGVGDELVATVTGTVDPSISNTLMVNTAAVASATADPNLVNNDASIATPLTGEPRVELVKTASAPIDVNGNGRIDAGGDQVAYTFTVNNTGNVTLTSAAISDPMLGGAVACAGLNAPLAPGGSVTCGAVNYTLTQQDLNDGVVHNTAAITAQSAYGAAEDDAEAYVTIPAVSGILLTKDAGPVTDTDGSTSVTAGDTINYVFQVRNTGTTTLTAAQITDPMLGGVVACPQITGVALQPGHDVVCFPPIPYTLTQGDIDGGMVVNTATIVADSPIGEVEDSATVTADIAQSASIRLEKEVAQIVDTDGDGRVSAGDMVMYNFHAANTGTTTLTDVTIFDPLLGGGAVCASSVPVGPGQEYGCHNRPYELTQDDIEAERVDNTATATGISRLGTMTDSSTASVAFVGVPAVELTKTPGQIAEGADGMLGAGDVVPYTFTIRNSGTTVLRDIVLDDPLLGGVLDCAALEAIELAPGEDVVCGPFDYELLQSDVDADGVENFATVSAQSRAGVATDDAEAFVRVWGTDAIDLLKSAAAIVDANGNGRTDAGDTIAYTFTVTNAGTTTLDDVEVTDPRLDGVIVCEATTLAPAEATVCEGPVAVLTQAEVNAGEIVNTAEALGFGSSEIPPTDTDTVTTPIVAQPAIALTKTGGDYADTDGNGEVSAGDTVKFRFVVTNTGAITLTDIELDDPKLGAALDCDVPDLMPDEKAECGPISYVLTASDVADGKVVNVATVSGSAGAVTVTAAASATVDLDTLATTGGAIAGIGWALVLLAGGALILLVVRLRRRGEVLSTH